MRRAALLTLALAALAACTDQPTLSEPPAADGVQASASTAAAPPTVSPAQTVAWNEPSPFGGNLPYAEAGGGRVVWQDASGPLVVRAYDFGSGARWQVGMVYGDWAYPSTAGRWTVWSDENWAIHLRDESTGAERTIGTGFSPRVAANGRVAYVSFERPDGRDARNRNVSVYDAATGTTHVLTRYTDLGGQEARDPVVDGDLVVWGVNGVWPNTTYTLRMMNLATGEERELLRSDRILATRVSVSGGRIVWTEVNADRTRSVMLYDVATRSRRPITGSAARPGWDPRISGGLVVWEDTRNVTNPRVPNSDIFGYDLASGAELAIATGTNHQGWPSLDGNRVVWTENANGRWEIRTATVQTVTLQSISRAVSEMLASGEIRNRGAAQSLQSMLAQAMRAHDAGDVAGERAALQRFRKHVQQLAGKQITASAAARLVSMADTLLRSLGG